MKKYIWKVLAMKKWMNYFIQHLRLLNLHKLVQLMDMNLHTAFVI